MDKRKLKIALSLAVLIPCVLYAAGIWLQEVDGLKEVDFTLLEQLCDIQQAPCTLNPPQRYDIGIIKHVVERIRTGVSNTFDDELSLYEHLECLLESGGIQFHFLHLFKIFLAELVVRQDIPQQHIVRILDQSGSRSHHA